MAKWHSQQLKVAKARFEDIEQGRVRIPIAFRGAIDRADWCLLKVGNQRIFCQVYGDDSKNPVIRLDQTYRAKLDVDVGASYPFKLRRATRRERVLFGMWEHPQLGVQVSTHLGGWGLALGIIGLALGLLSIFIATK